MQLHYPLNPATGAEDQTQLPWTNGVPQTGQEGSYPPFALCTEPMYEIVNVLVQAGIVPSSSDPYQLTRAIRGGQLDFAVATGTPDAIVATIGLAHLALKAGLPFTVTVPGGVANATTTPALTITGPGGVGPVTGTITKLTGAPVAIGDLPPNAFLTLRSDGVRFRLLSVVLASDVLPLIEPWVQGGVGNFFSASGAGTYTGVLTPALTALAPGMRVWGFFGNGNAMTSPTLDLGTGPLPIQKQGGGAPASGDVFRFVPFILNQAGTAWVINGFVASDIAVSASIPGREQYFYSSGAFTVPAGVTQVEVELQSAGGAGGASGDGSSGGITGNMGAGGGGGVRGIKRITGLTSGQVIPVTLGVAGVGVAGATGTSAGTSSFGSYLSCTGGTGGIWGANTYVSGGAPGVATGADDVIPGGYGGFSGSNSSTVTISDIYRLYGRGGPAASGVVDASQSGAPGRGYGPGGSGASGGVNLAGAAGAPPRCIVRW